MPPIYAVALGLIALHTVDGRVIFINPADIVALVEPLRSAKKAYEGACIVNFSDGKSRGVAETCDAVMAKLANLQ